MTKNLTKDFFDSPYYLKHGRKVIELRAHIIKEIVGNVDGKKILDLGCGDGSLSIPLLNEKNSLTLVDLSSRMIEIANSKIHDNFKNKVNLINLSLDEFTTNAKHDIVICVGVMAHVPSIEAAFTKIASCLAQNGIAIVEYTSNPNPVGRFFKPYYHLKKIFSNTVDGFNAKNLMKMSEFEFIANECGLTILKRRRHLFPVPSMRFWPSPWVNRYVQFTSANSLFSKIGVEHIIILGK